MEYAVKIPGEIYYSKPWRNAQSMTSLVTNVSTQARGMPVLSPDDSPAGFFLLR